MFLKNKIDALSFNCIHFNNKIDTLSFNCIHFNLVYYFVLR